MSPTIRAFFLASLLLIAVPGCRGGPQSSVSAETAVEHFYSFYRGDFRTADRAFLSAALADAIATAIAAEKTSAARMRASDTPQDKPDLIEGEIFAGLLQRPRVPTVTPGRFRVD